MNKKIEKALNEFENYYNQFDTTIPKIEAKFHHTHRVVDYAVQIAESENLNEHDFYIAYVCALLHDIARFKQYQEYGTYDDGKSFDHGDVGYEILLKDDFISNFVDNEEDKKIVLKAVKNHNKFEIEEGLNEKELYFTKLTRDADKLDIMEKQGNEILDGCFELQDEFINAVYEERIVNRSKITWNHISRVFITMCFIFDLNFKKSYEIIEQKGLVEKKLDCLENILDSDIFIVIEEHVRKKIIGK